MAIKTLGSALGYLNCLCVDGTVSGFPDDQLLDRFLATRDGAAFEALMARHGPMVLRVCRSVLRNASDVEDAFQATFLVLVRKARTLRGRANLGGWLHLVAYRMAIQANAAAARRRVQEMRAGEMASSTSAHDPVISDELIPALHEEIARLPERLRLAVLLCDLQGVPQAQAAESLRWSTRTLQRGLAEGRERLKARLDRRGLAWGEAVMTGVRLREAGTVIPPAWREATIRAALDLLNSTMAAGAVSAAAQSLTHEVLKTMFVQRLTVASASLLGACMMVWAVGLVLLGAGGMPTRSPAKEVDPPARAANGKTVSPPKPTYIEVRSVLPSAVKQTIPPVRVVSYGLKYQDFDRLMAAVKTVTRAAPIRELHWPIRHQGHAIECRVVGTTHDYAAVTGLEMDRGRFFTDADNAAAQNRVVVSSEVAQALFPEEDPIGKSVKVGTDYYTVVGVVQKTHDFKYNVYMPLITCRLRFGERIVKNRSGTPEAVETQLSRLILEVRDGADVEAAAALVKSTLEPDHPKGDVEVVMLKPDRKTK